MTNPFESCSLLYRHSSFVLSFHWHSKSQNHDFNGNASVLEARIKTSRRRAARAVQVPTRRRSATGAMSCDSDMPRRSCRGTTCRSLAGLAEAEPVPTCCSLRRRSEWWHTRFTLPRCKLEQRALQGRWATHRRIVETKLMRVSLTPRKPLQGPDGVLYGAELGGQFLLAWKHSGNQRLLRMSSGEGTYM